MALAVSEDTGAKVNWCLMEVLVKSTAVYNGNRDAAAKIFRTLQCKRYL